MYIYKLLSPPLKTMSFTIMKPLITHEWILKLNIFLAFQTCNDIFTVHDLIEECVKAGRTQQECVQKYGLRQMKDFAACVASWWLCDVRGNENFCNPTTVDIAAEIPSKLVSGPETPTNAIGNLVDVSRNW